MSVIQRCLGTKQASHRHGSIRMGVNILLFYFFLGDCFLLVPNARSSVPLNSCAAVLCVSVPLSVLLSPGFCSPSRLCHVQPLSPSFPCVWAYLWYTHQRDSLAHGVCASDFWQPFISSFLTVIAFYTPTATRTHAHTHPPSPLAFPGQHDIYQSDGEEGTVLE